MCPRQWKVGLMKCLLHRAYDICSSWELFTNEVSYLQQLFVQNGYPKRMFQYCVNGFLSKKYARETPSPNEETEEAIFIIPYIDHSSIVYGKKVSQIFKRYFSINLRIVFTTFKVKNYFSLKCCTPLALRANVVYKFTCQRDANTTYIGKTKRHLAIRVREHCNPSTQPSTSAIRNHLDKCLSCQTNPWSQFSVLDNANSDFTCQIKEGLHIKAKQPTLNKQLFQSGVSFTLQIF